MKLLFEFALSFCELSVLNWAPELFGNCVCALSSLGTCGWYVYPDSDYCFSSTFRL